MNLSHEALAARPKVTDDQMEHKDAHAEISSLKETIKTLNARVEYLEKYATDIKREMELYKGTVERCRDVFKRHPKPEGASKWTEERPSEGSTVIAGASGKAE